MMYMYYRQLQVTVPTLIPVATNTPLTFDHADVGARTTVSEEAKSIEENKEVTEEDRVKIKEQITKMHKRLKSREFTKQEAKESR